MLHHYHLPPPSWLFMGQLNHESYLPLGQAKFVCKIFLQTESKYVLVNLHILYNGTIYGIYCIDYWASWQAIGQVEIMPSLPPWASAFQNRMSTPAASRILSVDVCSERICYACQSPVFFFFKLLGFSRVGTIPRCIHLVTLTNLNTEICICPT